MWMLATYQQTHSQVRWFRLRIGGHPAQSPHSSNETNALSNWLCHDDNTINVITGTVTRPHCSTQVRPVATDGVAWLLCLSICLSQS